MIRCSSNSIQTAVNQTHHNYLVFFPVTFHWVHSHGKREMRLIDGKKLAKWCNYLMKEISQEQCQGCWIQDLSHAMHNHCLVFIIPFWPFWQSLENKRVLPDWMAKEFVIRVPRSEDFCTVSAAMKQCKNGNCFCIKPIQSSFCHSDTLICMYAAWNDHQFQVFLYFRC